MQHGCNHGNHGRDHATVFLPSREIFLDARYSAASICAAQIVEEKRKKTTLQSIWSTWQDVVQDAGREVSAEEREHLEALETLRTLVESNPLIVVCSRMLSDDD